MQPRFVGDLSPHEPERVEWAGGEGAGEAVLMQEQGCQGMRCHGYQVKSRCYQVTSHDCPFEGDVAGVGSQGQS
jgi:hypothetical protein